MSFLAICGILYAIKTVFYQIDPAHCWACGRCVMHCPTEAIQYNDQSGVFYIDAELCNGCGDCVGYCPHSAIYQVTGNSDNNNPPPDLKLSSSPNPMHAYTDFTVTLPKDIRQAELLIVNSKGQSVYFKTIEKTTVSFRWDGRDKHGNNLPNGVYFASLTCGKAKTINKITLVR